MKRKGFRIGACCIAASILLGGCGDGLYELTPEEQAAIVGYSSHIVSKFNKKQSEGVVDVAAYKAALAEKEAARKARVEEAKKEEAEKEELKNSQSQQQGETKEAQYVSLNQALKLGGVDAIYKGYQVDESYKETESYMVTANSGNELLILNIDLKNGGNKKVSCDMLSKMATFRITVNGSNSKEADTTILLNDLGTYQGSIDAGATKKTVLLFQFPKGTVKNAESLVLDVTIDGDRATAHLI